MESPPIPALARPTATPKKRTYDTYSEAQNAHITKAGHVENALRDELHHDFFCDTPDFITTLFDVSDTLINDIFDKAKAAGEYSEKCWSRFPQGDVSSESRLYQPFVEVANFISSQACRSSSPKVRWLSDFNRAPPNSAVWATDFKPDIISVVNFPEMLDAKAKGRTVKAPWTRIHTPVEVKRHDSQAAAALQLLKYLRQVFRESFDRRFVFGLVLAGSQVAVYLADRSGVLGSEIFDINEKPEFLIRIVAGISTFAPSKLGWDPTLTVYNHKLPHDPYHLSIDTPFQPKPDSRDTTEHPQWRLEIQKPLQHHPIKMSENMTESFILWRPISLARGEVILGRATRIWRAWHSSEMQRPESERQLYIVKDTWRDERRALEGTLYAAIGHCDGVAELHSFGVVQIDKADDTTSAIRHHLLAKGPPRMIDAQQYQSISKQDTLNSPEVDWDRVRKYVKPDYLPALTDFANALPRGRIHSRLVMKTFGWPIKFAKSLPELVGAMRDALVGHKRSYEKGVLHRDISLGNILITPNKSRGKRGVLIDYDNAIFYKIHQSTQDDPLMGTRPFMSPEMLSRKKILVLAETWDELPADGDDEVAQHAAVHDLEGFFWVLVWICISRCGPAQRRIELTPEGAKDNTVAENFAQLFESDDQTLGSTKRGVFRAISGANDCIKQHLSPWASPLKPLIIVVYTLLREAYRTRHFDGLHDTMIKAFEDAEELLQMDTSESSNATYVALKEKEERRREVDLPGHWDIQSPSGKSQPSHTEWSSSPTGRPRTLPPPPESPTPTSKRPRLDNTLSAPGEA